jgi:hypothetical protein
MTTTHKTSSVHTFDGGSFDLRTGYRVDADGWYTVPTAGAFYDSSWDGRGESVEVQPGDRVRLVSPGGPHSLAVIEVERTG